VKEDWKENWGDVSPEKSKGRVHKKTGKTTKNDPKRASLVFRAKPKRGKEKTGKGERD